MNSKKLEVEISWGNIQDQIAAFLYAMKKIPIGMEVVSLKLDYPKGNEPPSRDKVLKLEITTRKGVEIQKF